ncbi:hypothetical protein GOBAR_DD08811 [Gossypium barbadense]|nr:hypothetical protein GOBAR_DD08811 [Gossypium barbadense]
MAPYEMRRGRKLIMTYFYVLRSTYYLFKDHAYQGNFNVQSDDASSSDIPTIARHFGHADDELVVLVIKQVATEPLFTLTSEAPVVDQSVEINDDEEHQANDISQP